MTQPLTVDALITALKGGPCNLRGIQSVVEKTGKLWAYKTGKPLPPGLDAVLTADIWGHVKDSLEAMRPPAGSEPLPERYRPYVQHLPDCQKSAINHWSLCPQTLGTGDCTCKCSCGLDEQLSTP